MHSCEARLSTRSSALFWSWPMTFCYCRLTEGGGDVHRHEEIACEEIRVEVAERRRDTQLFGGDPTVRVGPFHASSRNTLDRFLQIHCRYGVGVDAHVLREKTSESFQTSAF